MKIILTFGVINSPIMYHTLTWLLPLESPLNITSRIIPKLEMYFVVVKILWSTREIRSLKREEGGFRRTYQLPCSYEAILIFHSLLGRCQGRVVDSWNRRLIAICSCKYFGTLDFFCLNKSCFLADTMMLRKLAHFFICFASLDLPRKANQMRESELPSIVTGYGNSTLHFLTCITTIYLPVPLARYHLDFISHGAHGAQINSQRGIPVDPLEYPSISDRNTTGFLD